MTDARYLAGRLLLAMPGMPDTRFDEAVIALCMHDANGALGVGIGAELDGVSLYGLLDDLGIERGEAPDCPVHYGGPVEPQRGFVLHTPEWFSENTLLVEAESGPVWGLSTSREVLVAITEGRGPRQWLMALGYAGWGAGQLDGEMRHHGWYATEPHPEILFGTPVEGRWSAAWRADGVDPSHLSPMTGRA